MSDPTNRWRVRVEGWHIFTNLFYKQSQIFPNISKARAKARKLQNTYYNSMWGDGYNTEGNSKQNYLKLFSPNYPERNIEIFIEALNEDDEVISALTPSQIAAYIIANAIEDAKAEEGCNIHHTIYQQVQLMCPKLENTGDFVAQVRVEIDRIKNKILVDSGYTERV